MRRDGLARLIRMTTPPHRDESPLGVFTRFVHSQTFGSALLLLCTIAALALANSRWADAYFGLLYKKAGLSWETRGSPSRSSTGSTTS